MPSIITLTMNPAIDTSAHCDRVQHDVKLRLERVRRDPGGGGINVSRAVAHLGGRSTAVFPVGGVAGELLQSLLAEERLTREAVAIEDTVRENLTVAEDSTGEQFRFGMPGPALSPDEVETMTARLAELIGHDDIFVASGSLPPGVPVDFYARVGRIAAEAGARYVVDTSGDALAAAVDEGAWLIKPNLRELASLLDEERLEEPQIREAATAFVSRGQARHVVVSLGSGGAYLVNEGGVARHAAPTVSVDSRIGAGDSMIGGIAWALAEGMQVDEAVRWGVAAGAAAVMTPGTELCRGEDVRRLLAEVG